MKELFEEINQVYLKPLNNTVDSHLWVVLAMVVGLIALMIYWSGLDTTPANEDIAKVGMLGFGTILGVLIATFKYEFADAFVAWRWEVKLQKSLWQAKEKEDEL